MIPAIVAHASPGRLRIKLPSKKGMESELLALGDQFLSCPGVISVEVNPLTGSILFIHQTSVAAIAEHARSRGFFALAEKQEVRKTGQTDFHRNITASFKEIDQKVRSLTGDEINAGGLAAVVLVGWSTVQILKGNAGPIPWNVALWYAFSFFRKSNEPEQ